MTKKRKKPIPIASKPIQMKSRKKARQITSLFHKLTHELDYLKQKVKEHRDKNDNDDKNDKNDKDKQKIEKLQDQINQMGGRTEYQRASQLSTKFHSTTKWVLKVLFHHGWLPNGRRINNNNNNNNKSNKETTSKRKQRLYSYQPINILEVGAINTEMIDAALKTKKVEMKKSEIQSMIDQSQESQHLQQQEKVEKLQHGSCMKQYKSIPMYNMNVRSIDIQSSHPSIEEQDFLTLPITSNYDVIICSMVLNCVSTPQDRGKMLYLLHEQLVSSRCSTEKNDNNRMDEDTNEDTNGGICFLTIPKLCLNQSKYMNRVLFEEMLVDGVGFSIVEKKESPKVAFWVLRKGEGSSNRNNDKWKEEWSKSRILYKAKKYRNDFAVILSKDDCRR